MTTFERMPFLAQNAVFRKLALITDITTLSKADRERYDYSLKNMRDHIATYTTAEENGFEKGRVQGRAEGEAIGALSNARRNARMMKSKGLDVSFISEITGLTADEIMEL